MEQAAVEQISFEIGINAVPWKKKRASRERAEASFSRNGHIHWNERSSRAVKSHEISFRALFIENSPVDGGEARLRGSSRVHRSALALSFPPLFSPLCSSRATSFECGASAKPFCPGVHIITKVN